MSSTRKKKKERRRQRLKFRISDKFKPTYKCEGCKKYSSKSPQSRRNVNSPLEGVSWEEPGYDMVSQYGNPQAPDVIQSNWLPRDCLARPRTPL